jgi:hypothetical protein
VVVLAHGLDAREGIRHSVAAHGLSAEIAVECDSMAESREVVGRRVVVAADADPDGNAIALRATRHGAASSCVIPRDTLLADPAVALKRRAPSSNGVAKAGVNGAAKTDGHRSRPTEATSPPLPPVAPVAPVEVVVDLVLATSLASSIKIEPVEFLDSGTIPKGKLVVIVGLGGAGKGMFWANLVADLTTGRATFGINYQPPPAVEVLLLGVEDGFADTVNPRLLAAGADLDKVHVLDGVRVRDKVVPFSLALLDPLDAWLQGHEGVRLLVIDPITGYVGRTGAKDHYDADVRCLLEPLAELASRRGVTILLVKHFNKNETMAVASRVGGSVAYVNVPRACFVVAEDPKDKSRRVLAPFKWNLNVPRPPALAWTMSPAPEDRIEKILAQCPGLSEAARGMMRGQLHRLEWAGPVDASADDLLRAAAKADRQSTRDEAERATAWLADFLSDGPRGSVECARDGDFALGRDWPPHNSGHTRDERERCVLGRVKWWREIIPKSRLGGEVSQAGFHGPYFFKLPDHTTRGLWPPSTDAIQSAQNAWGESLETGGGVECADREEDIAGTGRSHRKRHKEATEATEASACEVASVASVEASVASVGPSAAERRQNIPGEREVFIL